MDMLTTLILSFSLAFILSFVSTPLVRKMAFKMGAVDVPDGKRRIHKKSTPLIGGLAKLGVNFILVGNPDIAIVGAPVGTFVCFLVIMILNLIAMRRVLDEPPKLLPRIWKTGVAALVMGVGAYVSYSLLGKVIASTALCCLGAIAVAIIIYALLVIALKAITYEDCLLLPKGEKFAKILRLQ